MPVIPRHGLRLLPSTVAPDDRPSVPACSRRNLPGVAEGEMRPEGGVNLRAVPMHDDAYPVALRVDIDWSRPPADRAGRPPLMWLEQHYDVSAEWCTVCLSNSPFRRRQVVCRNPVRSPPASLTTQEQVVDAQYPAACARPGPSLFALMPAHPSPAARVASPARGRDGA